MRVRCTATADYRSNAVGELEIGCSAEGLRIALRGVSSYREGYAPGPPVHASDVCVPWPGVYATRLGESQLQLSIDPRSISSDASTIARYLPLNRFVLAEFSERPPDAASGLLGRQGLLYALVGCGLVALGVCLALARALPHARAAGTLGWAALVVVLVLGALAWRAHAGPQLPAPVVLDELCHELSRHVPQHISAATPEAPPRSFEPPALLALLPRSAVAIAITLAAATLAALVGSRAARPRSTASLAAAMLPAASVASSGHATSVAATRPLDQPPAAAAATGDGAECACTRHESLLWQPPLPRLSPVIVSERRRKHDDHEHIELELGLVNDSAREARQLNVSVVFFESGAAERAGHWQTGERPLFFEGPLAPGQAARWHVEGRGTSFDVIAPDLGTLAPDGSDAAPADAFVRLASDGARAIRLHAAQLLVFLGDAHAEGAVRELRSSASPAETDYLDRLLAPARDLGACALDVVRESHGWRVEACSFNRSDQAAPGLELRLRAFDAPLDRLRPGARAPSLLAEQALRWPGKLPAQSARRIELAASLSIDSDRVPRAFELDVARAEAAP
jgi:hypothetical protein